MAKKVLLLVVISLCVAQVASAGLITNVVRSGGASDDRAPIGVYDGSTAPLPTEAGGLMDGNLVFSDREYPWSLTPAELVGAEYIRTFNNDKNSASTVTYEVTLGTPAMLAIAIDDRWTDQQARIDAITAGFVSAGTFADTGLNVYIHESDTTDRPLSVFAATLPDGTYTLSGIGTDGNNFMVIGAVPEPATLALLGLGGLLLRRKK